MTLTYPLMDIDTGWPHIFESNAFCTCDADPLITESLALRHPRN